MGVTTMKNKVSPDQQEQYEKLPARLRAVLNVDDPLIRHYVKHVQYIQQVKEDRNVRR
jgi:hypothetical protein